jgi:hypothetical protein
VERKRYIKIHFAVDINTKEVISMDVTTDDVHDSEVLPRLLKDASMNRDVAEAFMDRIRYREFIHTSKGDGCRTDYKA